MMEESTESYEYLDPDYVQETTRQDKRKTKVKTTKKTEPQLGKYSLSAKDFEDDQKPDEDAHFELYDVIEDVENANSASDEGDVESIKEEDCVNETVFDDRDIENNSESDDKDHTDGQNETYTVDYEKKTDDNIDYSDDDDNDSLNNDEVIVKNESEDQYATIIRLLHDLARGVKALARQNQRIQNRQDKMNERIEQLETSLKSLLPKMPVTKICWPIPNYKAFYELEERLRTENGLEDSLKEKLKTADHGSLKTFINKNLKNLFYNVGRFTLTGEPSKNSKHGMVTYKAQGLLCVQALIDCCQDMFGETTSNIERAIGDRLLRMNETKQRLGMTEEAQATVVSKTSVTKLTASSTSGNIASPSSGNTQSNLPRVKAASKPTVTKVPASSASGNIVSPSSSNIKSNLPRVKAASKPTVTKVPASSASGNIVSPSSSKIKSNLPRVKAVNKPTVINVPASGASGNIASPSSFKILSNIPRATVASKPTMIKIPDSGASGNISSPTSCNTQSKLHGSTKKRKMTVLPSDGVPVSKITVPKLPIDLPPSDFLVNNDLSALGCTTSETASSSIGPKIRMINIPSGKFSVSYATHPGNISTSNQK